jgi:glycosyltransferase involved in cell wall biosynthesis
MKVLFINTFERHGGAGIAAFRLFTALIQNTNAQVNYLAQFKGEFRKYSPQNYPALFRIGKEKFFLRQKLLDRNNAFKFETGDKGMNILHNGLVSGSDLIHLHWINQGFLSLETIGMLARAKPVIWTMHDMWAFTGGCTYSDECTNYKNSCGNCPFLRARNSNDLSNIIWNKKEKIYRSAKITLVGPSRWMAERAKESSLGNLAEIISIYNPIDTDFFIPADPVNARTTLNINSEGMVLLFGAQNIHDERKGFHYLKESLRIIKDNNPEIAGSICLVIFGEIKQKEIFRDLPVRVNYLGTITDPEKLKLAYQAASFYVHCARIDNLPNTIVESLSCGTPVISFESGGVGELIEDGYNGFLIQKGSSMALAECIMRISGLMNARPQLSYHAREKAIKSFSMRNIASSYFELYEKVIRDHSQ